MSNVIEMRRARPRLGRQARVARRHRHTGSECRARRTVAGVAGVELLYVLGLVVAVPIGPGAVAITIGLAYLLAVCVRTLLDRRELARRVRSSLTVRERSS